MCCLLSVTHFWKLSHNAKVFWLGYDITMGSGLAYDLFGGQSTGLAARVKNVKNTKNATPPSFFQGSVPNFIGR